MKIKTLLFAALATLAVVVQAQSVDTYPSKAVRFVVGFPPGGANDIMARLVGAKLQERFGQTFIIENKPGANAIIGTDFVAKSAPDGYTLLIGASGAMTFNPGLYDKLPYDPVRDFAPVTMIGSFPLVLAVSGSIGVGSVQELIALAKSKPGALNYGAGSTPFHLAAELFKLQTGTDMKHVPYKGSAATVNALLGGEVALTFVDSPPVVANIRAGKLRGLAVTSPKRAAFMPELPTVIEAGVADFEVVLWTSLFAPAGTPPAVVLKLQGEISRIVRLPEIHERMTAIGIDPIGGTPEALAKQLLADLERWTRVAKTAGIKAN
ncbi:MAG: tripartite tricarboxylate transporter substrate binding protein [Betaproteobacteria bacterium]|nr:tripartite tricarboxylate transporter substrate binding protein [Betaproteobacteria bacterium]